MKAYYLVTGVLGHVERADIRAADLTDADRRIQQLMCLDVLRRNAEAAGVTDWVGVVTSEGETEGGGYEMFMQAATPLIDTEKRP